MYKAILNESLKHKNYVVEHEELVCNGNNLIFTTIENFSGNIVAWVYQSLNEQKSFSYPANILLLSNYKNHEIFLHPDVKLFRNLLKIGNFYCSTPMIWVNQYCKTGLQKKLGLIMMAKTLLNTCNG